MKPEDRKRLKQHIDLIVEHKLPAELSSIGKIMQALRLAKEAQVDVTLGYFNAIELLGYINALEEDSALVTHELAAYQSRIREMEKHTSKSDVLMTEGVLIDSKTANSIETELHALRAENERMREQSRWIPVSERLPEPNKRVEFFGGFEQTTHIGYYRKNPTLWESENDGRFWQGHNFCLITHWMPLPQPPEME